MVNVQLPCAHSFHRGCITAWLSRGNNNCPLCNLTLTADMVPPSSVEYDPVANYDASTARENSELHSDSSESAEPTQVPRSPTRRRQQAQQQNQQRVHSGLSSSLQQDGSFPTTLRQCESIARQRGDRINSTTSGNSLPISVTVPERVQRLNVRHENSRP